MKSDRIECGEAARLLARVAIDRRYQPVATDQTWKETHAGTVPFEVNGWKIEIFNDCDCFDYVDSILAPDGRQGDFELWANAELGHPDDYLGYWFPKLFRIMEQRFIEAPKR